VQAIESHGYIRLAPWVFARADSTRIDRAAVKEAACTILAEDPLVLEVFTGPSATSKRFGLDTVAEVAPTNSSQSRA
jgi:hypothetical protein